MPRCWIGLGGNLGNVPATFDRAIALFERISGLAVVQVSSLYATTPIGADAGSDFLNAVAELVVDVSPQNLLARLQAVEVALGRKRDLHWGPRTLDLDILFIEQQQIHTGSLTVPHPLGWFRRFVLDPLIEINPGLVHPDFQRTVTELKERLETPPYCCVLSGGSTECLSELSKQLKKHYPAIHWETESRNDAVFEFSLQPIPASPPSRFEFAIDLTKFPTKPLASICNVLSAAMDTPRRIPRPEC